MALEQTKQTAPQRQAADEQRQAADHMREQQNVVHEKQVVVHGQHEVVHGQQQMQKSWADGERQWQTTLGHEGRSGEAHHTSGRTSWCTCASCGVPNTDNRGLLPHHSPA